MAAVSHPETIHDAARAGDVQGVLSFLSANPSCLDDRDRLNRTPLHLASWAGQAEVVRILCEKNADVGAAAADDMAAIHFSSQKGHAQVVRYLLAAGASVNARTRKGMTALHYAIQGSHSDATKLLIKRGASLDTKNKAGKQPVDLAKDEGFRSMVLAAEKERKAAKASKATDKKPKSQDNNSTTTFNKNDTCIAGEFSAAEVEGDDSYAENQIERSGVSPSPPKKKAKLQLPHLATDQENEVQGEEKG